jgi:hypothetical protein
MDLAACLIEDGLFQTNSLKFNMTCPPELD